MATVPVQFLLNADTNKFRAEIAAANAAVASLTASTNKLAASNQLQGLLDQFKAGMVASGAWAHEQTKLTNETNKYSQALAKNKLSYREASTALRDWRSGNKGMVNDLLRQQAVMRQSMGYITRNKSGEMVADMFRPASTSTDQLSTGLRMLLLEMQRYSRSTLVRTYSGQVARSALD